MSSSKKESVKKTDPNPSYREMIVKTIIALRERKGSSRQAIKKYILSNFKGTTMDRINTALRKGVDAGAFIQPKGPSGLVKLAKKEYIPMTTKSSKTGALPKKKTTESKLKKSTGTLISTSKKLVDKKARNFQSKIESTHSKKSMARPKKVAENPSKKAAASKKMKNVSKSSAKEFRGKIAAKKVKGTKVKKGLA